MGATASRHTRLRLKRRLQANWVWIRDVLIEFTNGSSLVMLDQVPSISSSRIKVLRQFYL